MANIFGDSYIKGSSLEGGQSHTYADLYAEFLGTKGDNVSAVELQCILKDRINLYERATPDTIPKKIKKNLNECPKDNQRCLLTGGWVGHAVVYEIERQSNGKYTFRVYNTGEGMQLHDQVEDEYKIKSRALTLTDIPENILLRKSVLGMLQLLTKQNKNVDEADQPVELFRKYTLPMVDGTRAEEKQPLLC